ncbi:vitamin K epoxide reductase family protein [Salinarchaeum sp. IM2453]|uniref:vitamin K epoxide reductase family protein n=1 Tax=Salinarchaeum sp. IM2453 TaxID=2862870 RepID=UPI001C839C66|nr:vitamin K epoxide reductase family protein [Salinarchaeum sp. IM2453]QZA88107.1 vitamin K epoxide reductase family protein [Salinarchaeum sp. IM2453]
MGQTLSQIETETEYGRNSIVNKLIGSFIVVAVIGWFASVFLTAVHFYALPMIDSPGSLDGSIAVLGSEWAYIGPIPLAMLGAGYYLTMMVLGGLWLQTKDQRIELPIIVITVTGLLASAYFVYLQLVPIGEICPFCMLSAAATTTLFSIELIVKYIGGGTAAPPVDGVRIWPMLFVGTILMTVVAMYGVTLAPIPTEPVLDTPFWA